MNTDVQSFDPIWEDKYKAGHEQRAPWDEVVSFLLRNLPKDKPRSGNTVLEVGCGTASNLWFAAREGFDVYGIDGSRSAIETARKRFDADALKGELRVGDFTALPYADKQFDLAIDRAALTCCGTTAMKKALSEIHRVLKPGGKFLFTPYADSHSSARSGQRGKDGVILDVRGGKFGQIRFLSRDELDEFLPREEWDVRSLELVEIRDMLDQPSGNISAQWRMTVAKH